MWKKINYLKQNIKETFFTNNEKHRSVKLILKLKLYKANIQSINNCDHLSTGASILFIPYP